MRLLSSSIVFFGLLIVCCAYAADDVVDTTHSSAKAAESNIVSLEKRVQQLEDAVIQNSDSSFNALKEELQEIKKQLAELSFALSNPQNTRPLPTANPHNKTIRHALPAKPQLAKKENTLKQQLNNSNIAETVYNFIKDKKYQQAIKYLRLMLHKYPKGPLAANMHYWLGNLYSLIGQHEQAATELLAVSKIDPHNDHCADAQLKLGLIYIMKNNWLAAKNIFHGVISKFPGTTSAQLAQTQLNQLKKDRH